MVFLEKLPSVLTARSILEYIQSDAAKACTGWFIGKCLDQLFVDSKYSTQLINMKRIDEEFEKIKLDIPNELKVKTDWETLNSRIFQAEIGICHKYQLMQAILSNGKSNERRNEASLLRNGILDTNGGVLSNLSVIHKVLVGNTDKHYTEKGLLEMWSEGIYNNMRINKMSAKTYQKYVDEYTTKAAITQFKGFFLFTGANTNSDFCMHQFDLFVNNLESQIETMAKTVPSYMKCLSNPDEKKEFILRPVLDGDFEPFVRRRGPGKRLTNKFVCGNIEEGTWNFEQSDSFDNDGSLLISGRYTICDQRYYMSVSKTNKAESVSDRRLATPFCVIPLGFKEKKMKAIICKSEPCDQQFLGNTLSFIDEPDDSIFTLSFK